MGRGSKRQRGINKANSRRRPKDIAEGSTAAVLVAFDGSQFRVIRENELNSEGAQISSIPTLTVPALTGIHKSKVLEIETNGAHFLKPMVLKNENRTPLEVIENIDNEQTEGAQNSKLSMLKNENRAPLKPDVLEIETKGAQFPKPKVLKNEIQRCSKTSARKPKTRERLLDQLKGGQLRFLQVVCQFIESPDMLVTRRATITEISALTGDPLATTKISYRRCKEKEFVSVPESAPGNRGWLRLKVPADVFYFVRAADQRCSKTEIKGAQKSDQRARGSCILNANAFEEKLPNPPPTTTTPEFARAAYDYAWLQSIDIPPSVRDHIGESHLRQLVRFGFDESTAEVLQQSLDNLAACIDEGLSARYRASVAVVFIEVMKRQNFFDAPNNYTFNRKRAQKALESDRAHESQLVRDELARIEAERSEALSDPKETRYESLDDIPF